MYAGDLGYIIDLDVGQDISGATSTFIDVLRPNGTTVVVWPATLIGASVLRYVTVSETDLVVGSHRLQARLTHAGATLRTSTVPAVVKAAFT